MSNQAESVTFAGLVVTIFRSELDGRLVVDINTEGLDEKDEYPFAVPNIGITVNEHEQRIDEHGEYVPRWRSTP